MKINVKLEYKPLVTPCDLSSAGLQEAVKIVGPSFVYELFVHPDLLIETRTILIRLSIDGVEEPRTQFVDLNPLRPHINLHTNFTLGPREWVIGADDILAGSVGVV